MARRHNRMWVALSLASVLLCGGCDTPIPGFFYFPKQLTQHDLDNFTDALRDTKGVRVDVLTKAAGSEKWDHGCTITDGGDVEQLARLTRSLKIAGEHSVNPTFEKNAQLQVMFIRGDSGFFDAEIENPESGGSDYGGVNANVDFHPALLGAESVAILAKFSRDALARHQGKDRCD